MRGKMSHPHGGAMQFTHFPWENKVFGTWENNGPKEGSHWANPWSLPGPGSE